MNRYLEKIAARREDLQRLADSLGVVTTTGSQWRRALRESRNFHNLEEFQQAWKYKVPNTFPGQGKELPFHDPRPFPMNVRDENYHSYNRVLDAVLSLRNRGHKVTMLEGGQKAFVVPRGKEHSLPIEMTERRGQAVMEVVGNGSTPESFSQSSTRGRGLYSSIHSDLSKELRKRGYKKVWMDPQSPVWKNKYNLQESQTQEGLYSHYIPLRGN